jgi:uncharacterized membrane protein (UPF0127 family)
VGTAAPRRLTARRSAAGLLLAAGVALSACGGGGVTPLQTTSARGFPLADLTVKRGGSTVLTLTVEIADTPAAREKGLMGVTKLNDQQGMAFVFPGMQSAPFWMKDTLIPLDIAFWDDAGAVVDMQAMTPCTADPCTIYNPAQPYRSAVEVRGGLLTKIGLRPGDVVQLARRAHAVSGTATTSP